MYREPHGPDGIAAFLWAADRLHTFVLRQGRQENHISLHPLTSVVITFVIASSCKIQSAAHKSHVSDTIKGECLLSQTPQSESRIEWLRDSIVSACHIKKKKKKNLFKANLIIIIFPQRGGEQRWERFPCKSSSAPGLEDVGNCWKQRILNFNLRAPISTELVIYLGSIGN